MKRQLDPHLFGTSLTEFRPKPDSSAANPFSPQAQLLGEKIEKIRQELDEWLKAANLRIERTNTKATVVDQRLDQALQDIREKMAFLAGKVKERQTHDSKIESMLERHNQIVQNFESRIAHALKTIEEQRDLIQKQHIQLDESRRYIERVKRL